MEALLVPLLLVVVVAIAVRLLAGGLDGDRIDAYLGSRGCKVLDRSWAPFGKGWFGEKNDRIYEVVYQDPQGNTRRATAKTSMFSGVYLTDDRVVESAPAEGPSGDPSDELTRLRTENDRLRTELARRGDAAS